METSVRTGRAGERGVRAGLLVGLLATGALAILTAPALLMVYGYSDDYIAWMWYPSEWFFPARSVFAGHGRLLLAYLTDWAYGWRNDLPEFRSLRFISVIGWGLFAAAVWRWVLSPDRALRWRVSSLGAMLLTPPVAVCLAWSVCFAYGWAAALAVLAGASARAGRQARTASRRLVAGLGAAVLLVIALGIYQPAAVAFFLPLLGRAEEDRAKGMRRRDGGWDLLVFGGAAVAYWLLLQLQFAWLPPDESGMARTRLGDPSWERVLFVLQFFWRGLQSWSALAPPLAAWAVGLVTTVLVFRGAWRGPGLTLAGLVLLASAVLPVLPENVQFFVRLLLATSPMLAFLAVRGLEDLVAGRLLSGWRGERTLAIAVVLLLAGAFAFYSHRGLVLPAHRELAWMRAQAAELEAPPERLVYVMPRCGHGRMWPGRPLGEFGRMTSCMPNNAGTMILFVLSERFPSEPFAVHRYLETEVSFFRRPDFLAAEAEGRLPAGVPVWRGDCFGRRWWTGQAAGACD